MHFFKILELFVSLVLPQKIFTYTFFSLDGVQISFPIRFTPSCRGEQDRIQILPGIALPECVKECGLRPACQALNYNRQFITCHLYSTAETSESVTSKGTCVDVKRSDIQIMQVPCVDCDQEGMICVPSEQTCKHKECPNIQLPDNGKILGNLKGVGDRIEYACNFGYRVNGLKNAVCLSNGTWGDTETKCDKIPVRNVAFGKPTEMSTVFEEFGGYRGVDGLTDRNNADGCFLTLFENNPWWRVDLEGVNSIINVTLFNRYGNTCNKKGFSDCSHQAFNLKLSVGLSLEAMSEVGFETSQIKDEHSFSFTEDIQAQYVKVELIGEPERSLQLCEVQVFGFQVY